MFKFLYKLELPSKVLSHYNDELVKEIENNGLCYADKRNMNIDFFVQNNREKNIKTENWNKKDVVEEVYNKEQISLPLENSTIASNFKINNQSNQKKKKNENQIEEENNYRHKSPPYTKPDTSPYISEEKIYLKDEALKTKEIKEQRNGKEEKEKREVKVEIEVEEVEEKEKEEVEVKGKEKEKEEVELKEKEKEEVEVKEKEKEEEEEEIEEKETKEKSEENVEENQRKSSHEQYYQKTKYNNIKEGKENTKMFQNEYSKGCVVETNTRQMETKENDINVVEPYIDIEPQRNRDEQKITRVYKETTIKSNTANYINDMSTRLVKNKEDSNEDAKSDIETNHAKIKQKNSKCDTKCEAYTQTDLFIQKEFLNEIKNKIMENVSSSVTDDSYNKILQSLQNSTKCNLNEKNKEKYLETCKNGIKMLFELYFDDLDNLLCKNMICSQNDLENIEYVTNIKKKYTEEINTLKKKEKMLSDINERQTNQLLQLTYQMPYIKNDNIYNEMNIVTEQMENMELEIKKLKEEEQKLNELLQDKMQYMRKNFELKCYIKNLKSIINKNATLCSNLKNEKKKLTEEVKTYCEKVKAAADDAEALKRELEEMKKKEQILKSEVKCLRRKCDCVRATDDEELIERAYSDRKEETKRETEINAKNEEAETRGSINNKKEMEEKGNGNNAKTVLVEVIDSSSCDNIGGEMSSVDNIKEGRAGTAENIKNEKQNNPQHKESTENKLKNLSSYELILQECKSFTRKSQTNAEIQLREMKKLLSNEIKKNEQIQKKYLNILDKFREMKEKKHKERENENKYNKFHSDSCDDSFSNNSICAKYIRSDFSGRTSENNSRSGEWILGNRKKGKDEVFNEHTNLRIVNLENEIKILTKEIEMMRQDQLVLQKDVNNKSKIISYLIKKHALNEERFRLDGNWNKLNTKLKYEEMQKLMEETLIENIRLRTDLITLAKSIEEREKKTKSNIGKND